MVDARRCYPLGPNKTPGHMGRKECRHAQNKKEGGLFTQLRLGPPGEWVSNPNNIRWMLAVVHMDQGKRRPTRWHAPRADLSARDNEVAIITESVKSLVRVGNPGLSPSFVCDCGTRLSTPTTQQLLRRQPHLHSPFHGVGWNSLQESSHELAGKYAISFFRNHAVVLVQCMAPVGFPIRSFVFSGPDVIYPSLLATLATCQDFVKSNLGLSFSLALSPASWLSRLPFPPSSEPGLASRFFTAP
jgi:hypothetical protein